MGSEPLTNNDIIENSSVAPDASQFINHDTTPLPPTKTPNTLIAASETQAVHDSSAPSERPPVDTDLATVSQTLGSEPQATVDTSSSNPSLQPVNTDLVGADNNNTSLEHSSTTNDNNVVEPDTPTSVDPTDPSLAQPNITLVPEPTDSTPQMPEQPALEPASAPGSKRVSGPTHPEPAIEIKSSASSDHEDKPATNEVDPTLAVVDATPVATAEPQTTDTDQQPTEHSAPSSPDISPTVTTTTAAAMPSETPRPAETQPHHHTTRFTNANTTTNNATGGNSPTASFNTSPPLSPYSIATSVTTETSATTLGQSSTAQSSPRLLLEPLRLDKAPLASSRRIGGGGGSLDSGYEGDRPSRRSIDSMDLSDASSQQLSQSHDQDQEQQTRHPLSARPASSALREQPSLAHHHRSSSHDAIRLPRNGVGQTNGHNNISSGISLLSSPQILPHVASQDSIATSATGSSSPDNSPRTTITTVTTVTTVTTNATSSPMSTVSPRANTHSESKVPKIDTASASNAVNAYLANTHGLSARKDGTFEQPSPRTPTSADRHSSNTANHAASLTAVLTGGPPATSASLRRGSAGSLLVLTTATPAPGRVSTSSLPSTSAANNSPTQDRRHHSTIALASSSLKKSNLRLQCHWTTPKS
eukprot:c13117_g1_i8.p1 GENE.c13117_g1_i8~~c13117_g1_i8.p1  ORF type:complete len:646 (+),score=165.91 c13117_g1_i8:864-2801(+)